MDQHGGIKRKVESDDYSESLFEKKKGPRAPWTSQDMISAMMLVKQGMSITKAAQSLNIPRTTLRDRVTGKVKNAIKLAPHAALSSQDERTLVNYCKMMTKQGYGKTKEMTFFMAERLIQNNGFCLTDTFPDEKWWTAFCARNNHPSMFETDEPGSPKQQVSKAALNNCYHHLLKALTSNKYDINFLDHPDMIFNCNENCFQFNQMDDMMKGNAHNEKSSEVHPNCEEVKSDSFSSVDIPCSTIEEGDIRSSNTGSCSVITCCNALGQTLPPMFVHSSQNPDSQFDSHLEKQASHRLERDFLLEWFQEVFLNNIPRTGPSVLLYDGSNSFITKDFLVVAAMAEVVLFCIPASLSPVLQPLDMSINGLFQESWKSFLVQNSDDVGNVSHSNFSHVFLAASKCMISSSVISDRFKTVGIYPFLKQNALLLGASEAGSPRVENSQSQLTPKDFLMRALDSSGISDNLQEGAAPFEGSQTVARHARVITRPTMSNLNQPLAESPAMTQMIAEEDEYRTELPDIYHEVNSTDGGVSSSSDEANANTSIANTGASLVVQSKIPVDSTPVHTLPVTMMDQRMQNKRAHSSPVDHARQFQKHIHAPYVSTKQSTANHITKVKKKTPLNQRTVDLSTHSFAPPLNLAAINHSPASNQTTSHSSLNAFEELLDQRRIGKFQNAFINGLEASGDSDPLYPVWLSLKQQRDTIPGHIHGLTTGSSSRPTRATRASPSSAATVIDVNEGISQPRVGSSQTEDYRTIVTPAGNVSVSKTATVIVILPEKPDEKACNANTAQGTEDSNQ